MADFLTDNVDDRPDEIWIVRINPEKRTTIPLTTEDIMDRRNELSGNLALNQELRLIELVNRWIDEQYFNEKISLQFKKITVRYIDMSPEISVLLDYASKLDRSLSFIQNLIAHGEKQTEIFLQNLNNTTSLRVS